MSNFMPEPFYCMFLVIFIILIKTSVRSELEFFKYLENIFPTGSTLDE